jgi:hypothetical protein
VTANKIARTGDAVFPFFFSSCFSLSDLEDTVIVEQNDRTYDE